MLVQAEMPHARQLASELLLFLRTKVEQGDESALEFTLSPPRQVEQAWRALLLETVLYRTICGKLGAFVHHSSTHPSKSEDRVDRVKKYVSLRGFDWDEAVDAPWSRKRPAWTLAGDFTPQMLLSNAVPQGAGAARR